MIQKSERIAIADKKVKRLFKKGERNAIESDFIELLKRAVKPQSKLK